LPDVPDAGYEAATAYVPTCAALTVQVAWEVFVPTITLSAEFGQDGDPGLCVKVHWMLPVGAAVVLLGGTTVDVNVRVSPSVDGFEEEVAATRTVVVAGPRATKLREPADPSGARATTVICWDPLFGQVGELAFTHPVACASHCCTGLLTEMEYPTGVVPLLVPPTVKVVVGVGVGGLVPSLTATVWDPVSPFGTVKVTAASPLGSVEDPWVMVAGVEEPPATGVRLTARDLEAAKPVTKTVADDPAGPDAGEGAPTSR
jgi:hypothetical protein